MAGTTIGITVLEERDANIRQETCAPNTCDGDNTGPENTIEKGDLRSGVAGSVETAFTFEESASYRSTRVEPLMAVDWIVGAIWIDRSVPVPESDKLNGRVRFHTEQDADTTVTEK